MSTSTAELTLIIKAQNLADAALDTVKTKLGGLASTAKRVAGDIGRAFLALGQIMAQQFVNVISDVFTGDTKHLAGDAAALGITLAGAIAEGLSITLVPLLVEKAASSRAMAPLAAALAGEGTILGGILSTAIAVGAAALPFVLLAVAVAALVYLAVNPEARQKAHEVALMILGRIGDGLRTLGKILYDRFVAGFNIVKAAGEAFVGQVVRNILQIPVNIAGAINQLVYNFKLAFYRVYYMVKHVVGMIIDAILAIPRAIANALSSIASLGNTKFQVSVDRPPRHAEGGWIGLNGPELGVFGEKGPEYVIPNHDLAKMGATSSVRGVTIVGISEREIMEMVDRGLYFKLRRAAPTSGRV